jgi:formylmethanofuran dehydrogenase subunit A
VIIVKDGEVLNGGVGKTYWVNPRIDKDLKEDIDKRFLYYTVNPENYEVGLKYLPRGVEVQLP